MLRYIIIKADQSIDRSARALRRLGGARVVFFLVSDSPISAGGGDGEGLAR